MFGEIQVVHYRHVMASTYATEVAELFKNNYPAMASDKKRAKDIAKRCDSQAILTLLREDISYFLAREFGGGALAGFIERNTYEVGDGYYEQMTWIMVDEQLRGKGIATALHNKFINFVSYEAEDKAKPTVAQLVVHKDNVGAQEVYSHWGYRDIGETHDGQSIFMVKDVQ